MMPADSFDRQYPKPLREAEFELIVERRDQASPESGRSGPVVGLAFSGGGIRSATFCLGVLQALASARETPTTLSLRDIDLLSTVSGGGYVGAFLGAMFARDGATPSTVEEQLTTMHSGPVHWLRENGRYLAPNGAGDQWLAAATVLRNWVAVALVVGISVLTVLMFGQWMEPVILDIIASHPSLALGSRLFSLESSGIYWSPFFAAPILALLFLATPLGWAYWLGRLEWRKRDYFWVWVLTVVVTVAAFVIGNDQQSTEWNVLGVIGVLTLGSAVALSLTSGGKDGSTSSRLFRNRTSRWLTGALILAVALLGIALIDTLGRTAYIHFDCRRGFTWPASLVTGIGVLLTAVRKLISYLSSGPQKKHVAIPLGVIAALAGILVAVLLAGVLSVVSHTIARGSIDCACSSSGKPTVSLSSDDRIVVGTAHDCPIQPVPPVDRGRAGMATLLLAVLAFLFGRSLPFVNLSSLTQFYSARLSRTYIGASNKKRQAAGATTTEEVAGDDLDLSKYKPHAHGGPLHFMNVTLNETVGGQSQVLDRDRKGVAMAIGPAGLSVGVSHHALWTGDEAIAPIAATTAGGAGRKYNIWSNQLKGTGGSTQIRPKRLSLSQWTAISGAAVATGMGSQTSLGLSLLLGIANVRLGYWWDSAANPRDQGGTESKWSEWFQRLYAFVLPVQSALSDEFLARFHGPHRQNWYLTDGGHFENTAVYELVRRRVPLIVVCDDGADPDYAFEDLGNLVRKSRLDFDADVEFLPVAADNRHFGSFDDLKPKLPFSEQSDPRRTRTPDENLGIRLSRRHLLIATITYPDGDQIGPAVLGPDEQGRARSLLLVIKPSLTGDEPLDVLQYAESHPSFPQEPTSDQFFDEAQWESYRKLGEHIGGIVADIDLQRLIGS
ncbi:MAG TPA: hypothetical protein VLV86_11345 [Vicinamibacterales bacterium]|nr:hypothetical protein [Vicinamibacterales bacterium]